MFKKIEIQNFRGIKELEIDDFKQVNLFVGGNNSGKTSVLEALQISYNRDFFNQVIFLNNQSRNFGLFLNTLKNSLEETEAINKHLTSVFYKSNLVNQDNGENTKVILTSQNEKQQEQKISLFPDGLANKEPSKWYSEIEMDTSKTEKIVSSILFSPLKDKPPTVNYSEDLPKVTRINSFFFENSLIYSGLESIALLYRKAFRNQNEKQLVGLLKKIDDSIEEINFDGEVFFIDLIRGEEKFRLDGRLMGEGIKKIFILSLVIMSEEVSGGCLLIDEIESGLHYTTQEKLWGWLFTIAKEKNIQIFATTHSMDCVKAFVKASKEVYEKEEDPDQARLYRLEKEGETIYQIPYDKNSLSIILERLQEAEKQFDWEVR